MVQEFKYWEFDNTDTNSNDLEDKLDKTASLPAAMLGHPVMIKQD